MATNTSKLLINEPPLQVLPTLAALIGLNEAIILQQIHYWLIVAERSKDKRKFINGRWWTYNTYKDWLNEFPFWSDATLRRAIRKLEDGKLLLSMKPNREDWDHTKWYSIDYDELVKMTTSMWSERTNRFDQNDQFLNESSEISSENSSDTGEKPPSAEELGFHHSGKLRGKTGLTSEEAIKRARAALERNHQRQLAGELDLSWLQEYLRPLAIAFVASAGESHKPISSDQSLWRKTLKQWFELGYTPERIKRTVDEMRERKLTIGGIQSITNMARDLPEQITQEQQGLLPLITADDK